MQAKILTAQHTHIAHETIVEMCSGMNVRMHPATVMQCAYECETLLWHGDLVKTERSTEIVK